MISTRRGFLGALLALPVAAAAPELLVPAKTIFLPPRGGWVVDDFSDFYLRPLSSREILSTYHGTVIPLETIAINADGTFDIDGEAFMVRRFYGRDWEPWAQRGLA